MIEKLFNTLLSSRVKEKSEKYILTIAIFSYLVHLAVILLNNQDLLNINNNFLRNPISAIYTPFSFILLYEVYLLIYYIPKSITLFKCSGVWTKIIYRGHGIIK